MAREFNGPIVLAVGGGRLAGRLIPHTHSEAEQRQQQVPSLAGLRLPLGAHAQGDLADTLRQAW